MNIIWKSKLRFFLSVIVIILLIFIFKLSLVNDNKIDENIEKIKIGMMKKNVLEILGEPAKTLKYEKQDSQFVRFVYDPKSRLSSTIPYIGIDASTEKVVHIVKEEE